MIAQAVAFNMFLTLFAILLIVLSLMKRSLEGKGGGNLTIRLSAILPPGSWQLVSETLSRPEVKSWYLALFGWVGMLLVGTQMMKLIIKGIELIYGENGGHSFLGRQLRALLLFSLSSVVWFGAVALAVFGLPLRQWIFSFLGKSSMVNGFWTILLAILVMTPRDIRPDLDIPVCTAGVAALEIRPAGSPGGNGVLVGAQFSVWDLRPEDTIWACLRRTGCGDWLDAMDGAFRDAGFFWRGLERGECRKSDNTGHAPFIVFINKFVDLAAHTVTTVTWHWNRNHRDPDVRGRFC